MSKYKHQQAIREKLDKELGSYKIDGKEFREMWGLFDLVVVFLDEQLNKKEEEVENNTSQMNNTQHIFKTETVQVGPQRVIRKKCMLCGATTFVGDNNPFFNMTCPKQLEKLMEYRYMVKNAQPVK